MASEESVQQHSSTTATTHWYVTDLSLSLQFRFHHHGLLIIATVVVFIAIFMSLLVCNFLNQCNDQVMSNSTPTSEVRIRNKGLDEATINSLPIFLHTGTTTATCSDQESHDQCSICLCSFQENEMVKLIPKCLHFYHSQCIDEWLQNLGMCPLCRAPLLPSTLQIETSASP